MERAFDEALGEAGGTLPVWLILLNLKTRRPANQRELAAAVGVREATLTHHLNAMDASGLITRTREAANRRVQVVALTQAGEAAFTRLRDTAIALEEAGSRTQRRRPGNAQYLAQPPGRECQRRGSRRALARPGRPPPGVTGLAADQKHGAVPEVRGHRRETMVPPPPTA